MLVCVGTHTMCQLRWHHPIPVRLIDRLGLPDLGFQLNRFCGENSDFGRAKKSSGFLMWSKCKAMVIRDCRLSGLLLARAGFALPNKVFSVCFRVSARPAARFVLMAEMLPRCALAA